MQHFEIGKTTVTVDRARQTITFDHADTMLGRAANSPWVVPAGAVEKIEFTPKSFLQKPSLRLTLRDRSGYNPGPGADMNTVIGGKADERAVAELHQQIEQLVNVAPHVDAGPRLTAPYTGPTVTPAGATQFGDLVIDGDTICCQGQAAPLRRAQAELVDADAARSRLTATRVAAGAIIAGPVGALVGGLAKKSTGRVYVMVTTDDGRVFSGEGPAKETGKAAELVAKVNAAH